MKLSLLTSLFVVGYAAIGSAQIVLMDNDFSSIGTGFYSGNSGASFGTANALGNATYNRSTSVQGSGGVGASRYAGVNDINGVCSRDMHSTTALTSFSFSFLATAKTETTRTGWPAFGAGWDLSPDGASGFNNATLAKNRLLIGGVIDDTSGTLKLGYFTEFDGPQSFSSETFTGSAGDDLIVDLTSSPTWLTAEFDLIFNATTDLWTVSNFTVKDKSMTVASLASESFFPTGTLQSSHNLDSITSAYAVTAGYATTEVDGLDEISITAVVPKPSTISLFAACTAAFLCFRQRRANRCKGSA